MQARCTAHAAHSKETQYQDFRNYSAPRITPYTRRRLHHDYYTIARETSPLPSMTGRDLKSSNQSSSLANDRPGRNKAYHSLAHDDGYPTTTKMTGPQWWLV